MSPDITKKEQKRLYDIEYGKKNKTHLAIIHKKWKVNNKAKISLQGKISYQSGRKKRFTENPQRYLWYVARTRARQKNIIFTINPEDIIIPEVCPITGNKLVKGDGYNPDAMSLDKVDNRQGYIKGNVRVISRWANLKKSSMTIQDLERLIKYMKGEI